jgi:hypothetical protein
VTKATKAKAKPLEASVLHKCLFLLLTSVSLDRSILSYCWSNHWGANIADYDNAAEDNTKYHSSPRNAQG